MTRHGLGLDIHEKILVRLQVNDLIRCKSVCKSWNSLIKSPRFVKSHLNKVDNNETGDTRITALTCTSMCVDDCWIDRTRECQVVGSSNGLVCISRNARDFLVVNPSTREVKELRNPSKPYFHFGSACVSGFGYDSSIDDYKVVIGLSNKGTSNKLSFEVLTLKSNTWRSVYVESGYDILYGNGIICNGAIHWYTSRNNKAVIVSFDLSKEVFKEIPIPTLSRSDWYLGTMKGCLCIFARPNINHRKYEDIEIWVMRKYNIQESWERKLPPPHTDTQKITMHYIPQEDFFNRHVHIWMFEEGSCAPVLLRSIERPEAELLDHNESYIRLYINPEYNYNYDEHVFVKSLVSPHGMGNGNGSCSEERVKRKRQNVVSPDGDGRSVKSKGESPVSRNSNGGRTKRTKQSLLIHDADCDGDGDGRRVERKRRERESHVFHSSDRKRVTSERKSIVSSYSDDEGRRADGKRKEREIHMFHRSDKGRALVKRKSLVSYDSDADGKRVERKRRERESHVFHSSNGGRATSERQKHVSYDSDGSGRRVERKTRERERERESHVFHCSDKGRAKIKRQSLVSSNSSDAGMLVERKRREGQRERESLVIHSSNSGRDMIKTQRHVSSDSDDDGRRVERKPRERESLVFHSSEGGRANSERKRLVSYESNGDGKRVERKRSERESHVSYDSDDDGTRVERKRRERESHVFRSSDGGRSTSERKSHVSYDSDGDVRRVEMRRR